ncbi:MAG: PEP-utilizing enzyme, partial [Planctomycetota bacterium]|nr:PEP-utilizing enzyme [Planctomycetota bacterium]
HDEVCKRIRVNRFTAEYAVRRSLRKFEKKFERVTEAYLAQRAADLRDIEHRLLQALLGGHREHLWQIDKPVVVIAHDLSPSETAALDRTKVMGFATDVGGMTGHTAIVARAREIPAVVGLGTVTCDVTPDDEIIIDGNRGIVILNPDERTRDTYRRLVFDFHTFEEKLAAEKDLPAVTLDGCRVIVMANIEFPQEIEQVLASGGDGVGLYRTEFIYVQSAGEPDEEQHFETYRQALVNLHGLPLAIRSLDLGADKFFRAESAAAGEGREGGERQAEQSLPMERNPSLGCRAIRYCLQHLTMFRQQIRAICRVSALGEVKLMIPLVSTREEVLQVRQIVAEVQEELAAKDIPFDPAMPIGIMVEVPAVALAIEHFCDVCDFFSIGTNDLTQYLLAADRTNEHVAHLYRPGHPAVLRLVRQVIEVAGRHRLPVSLCGEMAGDPNFVIFLLGLGLRFFSVSPPLIPEVKKLIRSVTLRQAEEIAEAAMRLSDAREVVSY